LSCKDSSHFEKRLFAPSITTHKAVRMHTQQMDLLWQQLCALAEKEQDPKRLAELVDSLDRILDVEELTTKATGQQAGRRLNGLRRFLLAILAIASERFTAKPGSLHYLRLKSITAHMVACKA
jgi:hypothetical protein